MKPIYIYLYIYTQWIGWECSEYPSSCGNPLIYGTGLMPPHQRLAGDIKDLKKKKKERKEAEEGEEKGHSCFCPWLYSGKLCLNIKATHHPAQLSTPSSGLGLRWASCKL